MSVREPILYAVKIEDLRPTQMTVGFREVEAKRQQWRERGSKKKGEFLGAHMIPVLLGPKERRYIIDHHHLTLALLREGESKVLTTVVADLSDLGKDEFWTIAELRGWCHPYDAKGVRRSTRDIPKRIADIEDDPYRSLAGELRRLGGFAKDTTPFSEFIWADFLRRRVSQKVVDNDFDEAIQSSMALAKSAEAVHLPGWCGPHASS